MATQSKSTTRLIIILVVIIAIGVAYFVFRPTINDRLIGDALSPAQGATELAPETYSSQEGEQLVRLLAELEAIDFDADFVRSEAFTSLDDLSREIEPEPAERENPFAPVQ